MVVSLNKNNNIDWSNEMKKIALVTGGSRGLGRSIAEKFKLDGYDVAVNYHSNENAAKEFEQTTGIHAFKWDVSDFDQCERGIKQVCELFGGHVDILVNNAGITNDKMLHKMQLSDWMAVLSTNLDSVFNMSRSVIQSMRNNGFGRIINISSINGESGQVGQTNYSASKAAIIGFTKSLALESAPKGITVNAIAPGYINTEMTCAIKEEIRESIKALIPVKRFGKAEEIANVASFLASEGAAFITGAVIDVNGGQRMS